MKIRQLIVLACSCLAFLGNVSGQTETRPDPLQGQPSQGSGSSINIPDITVPPTGIPTIRNFDEDLQPDAQPAETKGPAQQKSSIESNEFQDLVTLSTGRKLPIFGQGLFQDVPSTFAPLSNVPVPSDYVIGPGDELVIRAWGQVDIRWRATVDRNGDIHIPRVGQIHVAGAKFDALHGLVDSSLSRVFRNYQLNVSLGRLRSIQVFVVGRAQRPGSYTVSSLSTMLNAIFATGGPTLKGSLRNIELRRNDRIITVLDLYDLLLRGDKSRDVGLLPGDVIYIPPVQKLAAVAGSVNNPGIFEIKNETTLGSILELAGGLSTTAAGQRVRIERITDKLIRKVDQIALNPEGLRHPIADGDLVNVLPLSNRFENAVTLRGNVAVPGRYPWREGMRVTDLIPDRQSLITNEYWINQNAAISTERQREEAIGRTAVETGSPRIDIPERAQRQPRVTPQAAAPSDTSVSPGGTGIDVGVRSVPRLRSQEELQQEIRRNAPDINWEYAVVQRLNERDLTSELLPFNLRRAIDTSDSEDNLVLSAGDIVTIFSQADLQVPIQQQSKYVRIEGEFKQAGVYKALPGETLRQLVARMGGFSPQAYPFGAVFTRESTRISQQGKMDEAVNRLGQEVERAASYRAQNLTSPEEAAGLGARIDSQRRLVENLRKIRATGRIVLNIQPDSDGVEDLPELILEDGDRLYIPAPSSTVTVLGAVYNENDFIFKRGLRVKDYLRQSGGPTRTADKGRIYVIRADGSVRGQSGSGWLLSGIEGMPLNPGDTIVVPEKLDRVGFVRNLKDYTLIFSQFALGAAAINVLR